MLDNQNTAKFTSNINSNISELKPAVDGVDQPASLREALLAGQGLQSVKSQIAQTAPQMKEDVTQFARKFNPTLGHLIFLGYFLAIFGRVIFWQGLSFDLESVRLAVFDLLAWLFGGIIGWNLLVLDNLVFAYFTHPESQLADQMRLVLAKDGPWAWCKLLFSPQKQERLAFRSLLFQLAWVLLAFFALTSTASFFGKGVVLGLGLHLLLEQWQLIRRDPQELNKRLFWQIKRAVSLTEQKYYLYLFTAIFIFLSILV